MNILYTILIIIINEIIRVYNFIHCNVYANFTILLTLQPEIPIYLINKTNLYSITEIVF